ncbi:MAG: TonB-dependent receptor [Bryobacteraceae bacterium]
MRNSVTLLIHELVFGLLLTGFLFGQNASVSGQIVDSQGSGVPGATITLTNTATSRAVQTQSNPEGYFRLPPVPPGGYEMTAQANGFAVARVTALTLEVDQSKVVKLELQPATVKETINVIDTAPELTLDRADRSLLIEHSFVEGIPLNVRNPLQLINFSVGVTTGDDGLSGNNITSQSRTNTFRINGALGATTDILIDGGTDTTAYYNQAAGIPGIDAVREYRVYTDAYAPEFGRTSGGMVSYALKSGTNQIHGSAFEYLRNSDMDAEGFNGNKAGLRKPAFRRNQFGGTLGGPIFLPKLYNGRSKTFFFVSYDGLRDSSAGSFTGTMPTALERAGNFSKTSQSNGTPIVMYDPSTTTLNAAGAYIRTAFPGNIIPSSSLNPIAQKLLSYYPLPNQPGIGQSDSNNYFSNAPGTDTNDRLDIRMDEQLSSRQSLFGHFSHFANHIYASNYYGNQLAPVMAPDRIPGINLAVGHIWSISPSLVFEEHFSYAHSESQRNEPLHVTPTSLGFPSSILPGMTADMTPYLSQYTGSASSLGMSYPYERNTSSVYQYRADFSWLRGSHTFKFGVDLRDYPTSLYDPEQLLITATTAFTGGPNANAAAAASGNSIGDLLLGAAQVQSGYEPQTVSHHFYYGAYAQDAVRVTKKLTLTYGLRWSYESGEVEAQNQMNYIDLASPSPIASQVPRFPGLKGGVGIPGLNGTSRNRQIATSHFDPRLGVSYALNSKTIIHIGYGMFHLPVSALEQFPPALGTTRLSNSIVAQANGVTPLFNLSNPFPQGLPAPWGTSAGLAIALGQTIEGPIRTQTVTYMNKWSFDIQRQLPWNFVVTTAYSGNSGVHLPSPLDYNQLPTSDLALGNALLAVVSNPFYGIITDPSSTLSLPTVQAEQLMRPYPQFLDVGGMYVGVGHSSYHAGQLTVERRFANGLATLLGYSFSKILDNVGDMTDVVGAQHGFQNYECFSCDRSRADQDVRQSLRWSTQYELPFGPGKSHLNHGLASRVLGGWALGAFFTVNTGRPIYVTSTNNSSLLGAGWHNDGTGNYIRPNATGVSAALPGGPNICDNCKYFNPAAFSRTPQFAVGNVSRYLPDVSNPTGYNWDMLVEKRFAIGERYRVTFRAEFLNALNEVRMGGPTISVTSTSFGYISLTQSNTPRNVQLSLRTTF